MFSVRTVIRTFLRRLHPLVPPPHVKCLRSDEHDPVLPTRPQVIVLLPRPITSLSSVEHVSMSMY